VAIAEVVDHLSVDGGETKEAELTVFGLGAEALERGQAGKTTEPGEEIGEGDTAKAEGEGGGAGGGVGGQGEGDVPRRGGGAPTGVGDPGHRDPGYSGTVDGAVESRGGGVGIGVVTELAVQDDGTAGIQGRESDGADLANPSGIGGELVEENTLVAGPAPMEGAAERRGLDER
jgi:hypothetical protein